MKKDTTKVYILMRENSIIAVYKSREWAEAACINARQENGDTTIRVVSYDVI